MDLGAGFARLRAISINLLHNVQALYDLTENDVLIVQPGSLDSANEELRSVGVGSGIGRGQNARTGMLQGEVLVGKIVAIDRLAASAIVICEVTTLAHEVGDNAMETGALIAEAFFASAQIAEVS